MASEEDVRVVRCSRLELEKMVLDLEKQRGKTCGRVPKSQTMSGGKIQKGTKARGGNKRSDLKGYTKQNKTTSANYTSKESVKKLSECSNGVVSVDNELVKQDNVVNQERQGKMGKKNVRLLKSQNKNKAKRDHLSANSDSASDNDYDRGESGSARSLYDPLGSSNSSKYSSKPVSSKKKLNSHKPPKQKITDMMDKLHVDSNEQDLGGNSEKNENCQSLSMEEREDTHHEDTQQNMRRAQRKKAVGLFSDIVYLEGDLDNLLSRRVTSEKQLDHVLQLSHEIQEKCKVIMMKDLHFFTTKEVYYLLWRSGIYQVVECLRGLQKDNQEHDGVDFVAKISNILQEYLNSVCSFIHGMISSLEEEHNFLLKSFLEKPATYDGYNGMVKLALLCCHHFMIFLGDLERYKIHLSSVKEWSVPRSCYLKASKIAPRNGKPYNQLAVVAVYAKRRLDAVYYYIRSLTVSNPIMTAREKLHAIFGDVQRKAYELHVRSAEEDGSGLHCQGNRASEVANGRQNGMRRRRCQSEGRGGGGWQVNEKTIGEGRHELWVFYRGGVRREFLFTAEGLIKGGSQKQENNEKVEKANPKISLNEINKQFEVFYLSTHAMLFTKIGIDHFSVNHRKLLGLFKTMLRHPTCAAVGARRLVEMMAINIFEVANMTGENHEQFLEGTPLDLAITLGCDMFQCICKAISEILLQHFSSNGENSSSNELYPVILPSFLPAIKVWFDWMRNCVTLLRSSSVSIKEDFWGSVSVLLNVLSQVLNELTDVLPGDVIVTLMEDDHLSGFKPLAQESKPRVKIQSHSDKDTACTKLRIEAVHNTAKFLCEFEDLPLRFNETSREFFVTNIGMTSRSDGRAEERYDGEINEEDIDDDVIVESVEDYDSDPELANPVKELKAKKDALTKEILNQKQREEDAKAVLVEHSSKPTLVLEINPQYLVPDTNCFIDHLSDLQYIIETKQFTIVIPLVVINELDGLAKGSLNVEHSQQRGKLVVDHARAAINFLEYRFSLSDSQMLALTSKGSVLSTMALRSEEPTEGRGINDDIILNCCHHYCDANMNVVNKLASAGQPFTITRKVVLLTEDRNLRLKAHVQNIPVVMVPHFLEMIST